MFHNLPNLTSSEVYDSSKRPHRTIDELYQVIRFRYLIAQLLRRDILTRYKRSFLGIAWTMLNPLGTMIVLTVAFSQIFGMQKNYPAYVLSGLNAWNLFSQSTTASIVNLIWGGGMLHRVFIPRTSFAISAIGTGVVNTIFALVPMLLVTVVIGMPLTWSILFLPVPLLLLAIFSLGFGLMMSTFAVYFPDVAEMYQIVLAAWLYLSPVIYPEDILPAQTRWAIQTFNPLYSLIKLFRLPIYDGRLPTLGEFLTPLIISLIMLAFGWWLFTRNSDSMSYRI